MSGNRIVWVSALSAMLGLALLCDTPWQRYASGQEPATVEPASGPADKGPTGKGVSTSDSASKEAVAPADVVSPSDTAALAAPIGEADEDSAVVPRVMYKRQMLLASLTIFALAVFVGFEVITKVPPTLHTPLMSGSNAISGITVVGALIVAGHGLGIAPLMGCIAVILATVNVVGGFLVTHRMLAMFKKR